MNDDLAPVIVVALASTDAAWLICVAAIAWPPFSEGMTMRQPTAQDLVDSALLLTLTAFILYQFPPI